VTFPTTRLSLVLAAASDSDDRSREALAALCRLYWQPLHAYIRRHGYSADEAEDLTQAFMTRLIEKRTFRSFARERGRFRSFLLASLKHFLSNERDAAAALKRGGAARFEPFTARSPADESGVSTFEPRDDATPERAFEKQWAMAVLTRALDRVRDEHVQAGKADHFDRLRSHLIGDDEGIRYRQLALDLGTTEGAVKVAIHRLRRRFHDALRSEISLTVADANDVGDEIRYLIAVIRS
jgi:RNA polymerase sigma factor (sigma-70 family)